MGRHVYYLWTFLTIVAITVVGKALDNYFDRINIALLYLLPVLVSAVWWGRGPSLFASLLGVLAFDFFFVPPFYSLTVDEFRHIFVFAVFLAVALVTGTMATRLKNEAEKANEREKRTLALYNLGREIAAEPDLGQVLNTFVTTVAEAIGGELILLMPDAGKGALIEITSFPAGLTLSNEKERAVAQWVFEQRKDAGRETDTLRESGRTFFPVSAEGRVLAVMAVRGSLGPKKRLLVEAFANLAAVAIIRVELSAEAEQARWLAESEKLHSALLNSVSHDLRTPLAAITGAATALLSGRSADREKDRELLETIEEESLRMNRFVANLLDMVRLEGGKLRLKRQWCDIQDILGVALREIREVIAGHTLKIGIPPGLPLVMADFALIEHVMINLVENAAKYSPPGGEISISAGRGDHGLWFAVSDHGPSVPPNEREHIFDKFYRLPHAHDARGTGLGLSICRGIIEAHGGEIRVEPSSGGGNRFVFTIPVEEQPLGWHEEKEGGGDGG